MSLRSLRAWPEALGIVTMLLLAMTAWISYGRRAALATMLVVGVAFPFVIFSRVAMIEAFLLPAQAVLLLALFGLIRGDRVGWVVGAAMVLCFAVKASAALFIVPMLGGLLAVFALQAGSGRSFRANLKDFRLPGMIVAVAVAGAAFYMLVIHGRQAEWWFQNFTTYVKPRATLTLFDLAQKVILLPTHSEGVLVAMGPISMLAAVEAVRCLSWLRERRTAPKDPAGRLPAAELWRVFLTFTTILSIVLCVAMDTSGRRVLMIAPLMILLGAGALKEPLLGGDWAQCTRRRRAIILALCSPLLYVAARGLYCAVTQSVRAMVTDNNLWSTPFLTERKDLPVAGVELGVFILLAAIVLWIAIARPGRLGGWRFAPAMVVLMVVLQGGFLADYFLHRTYTMYDTSRELGKLLPPGTVVLGNSANAVCWENRIKPIFTLPGIRYANREGENLQKWNARFALVDADQAPTSAGFDWDRYAQRISRPGTSPFWHEFDTVRTFWSVYDVQPWNFRRQDAKGYYVLLERSR